MLTALRAHLPEVRSCASPKAASVTRVCGAHRHAARIRAAGEIVDASEIESRFPDPESPSACSSPSRIPMFRLLTKRSSSSIRCASAHSPTRAREHLDMADLYFTIADLRSSTSPFRISSPAVTGGASGPSSSSAPGMFRAGHARFFLWPSVAARSLLGDPSHAARVPSGRSMVHRRTGIGVRLGACARPSARRVVLLLAAGGDENLGSLRGSLDHFEIGQLLAQGVPAITAHRPEPRLLGRSRSPPSGFCASAAACRVAAFIEGLRRPRSPFTSWGSAR